MASVTELQKSVEDFIQKHNLLTTTEFRLLDLASEVGEICKARLKNTNYGRHKYHDGPHNGWIEELGDVFYSLICLANNDEIDLEMALNRALSKHRDRIEKRGSPESGR
jgi:NTP pyrophosphatase (non-canonical NTP hydrolase)